MRILSDIADFFEALFISFFMIASTISVGLEFLLEEHPVIICTLYGVGFGTWKLIRIQEIENKIKEKVNARLSSSIKNSEN